jgi:hypothetical protein
MLQAHSPLWHYLWVAPNLYLLVLAWIVWQRGIHKARPAFFFFCVLIPAAQLILFAADELPSVTPTGFWHFLWSGLVVEALVKFVLIGELFVHIFSKYLSVAKLGKVLIRSTGVVLILFAAITAAVSSGPNSNPIVSGPHILERSIYIIESGLLLFIFLFSYYFRLTSDSTSLGICLGLAFSSCVHLGTWAFAANYIPNQTSVFLDLLNMAAYHLAVLIWYYYVLVPGKNPTRSQMPLDAPTPSSEGVSLAQKEAVKDWNRELERLIHQ